MKIDKNQKRIQAKKDVDSVIKKHGFDAVRWVVNKWSQKMSLMKQLASEKRRLNSRIAEIESKLSR